MFFPQFKLSDEMIAKLPPHVQAHYKKQQQSVPKEVVSTQQSVLKQVVHPQRSAPNKPVAGGKPGDLYSNQDKIHYLPLHLQGRNNLGLHKLSFMDSTKHTAPTTVPVQPATQMKWVDLYSNQDMLHKLPPHLQKSQAERLASLRGIDFTKKTQPGLPTPTPVSNKPVPVTVKSVPATHKPTRRDLLKQKK